MRQAYHVDLPYPKLDQLQPDLCAAEIIAPAYASMSSELGAILQYLYHHFQYTERGMEKYATAMEDIAISEMTHFDLLGTALIRLGVDPVFTARPPRRYDYFNTSRIAYSTYPQKMLLDDIQGERMAIAQYEDMICRFHPLPGAERAGCRAISPRIRLIPLFYTRSLQKTGGSAASCRQWLPLIL